MNTTRASGILDVDYSQFWVGDDVIHALSGASVGGLLRAVPEGDGVIVNSLAQYGPVQISLQAHSEEPSLPSLDWVDVAVATVQLSAPRLIAVGLMGGGDTVTLILPRSGMYAVRVASVPARDELSDEAEDAERYLVDVWPVTAPSEPASIRVGSSHRLARLASGD